MFVLNELMDFGSFWTLWFWIVHVVTWSLASHFTMGVPYDLVIEANREDAENGPYQRAAEALINAQVFRFVSMWRRYGILLSGTAAFLLSMLMTLGTLGKLEFARALLTLIGPLMVLYTLTIRKAMKLERLQLSGFELRRAIRRQRLINQSVGLLALILAVSLAIHEALLSIEVLYW